MVAMSGAIASCVDGNAATLASDEDYTSSGPGRGAGAPVVTVDNYDDFSDGSTYANKWFDVASFLGVGEPEAIGGRSFENGRLNIEATPFQTSHDNVLDHMKYLALSTRSYAVPLRGSVEASADIQATESGCSNNRRVTTTGRRLSTAQQAAATLTLADNGDTGVNFTWYISSTRAIAVYQRTALDGACDPSKHYTQILQDVAITPGTHNFAIRYLRNLGPGGFEDKVDFVIDGWTRAAVREVGVPVAAAPRQNATFAAQGPGETLDTRLNRLTVGHGLGTMVDEFPFNQCPTGQVSIPQDQRIWGQGVAATFDNFRVETVQR
jgi:hypothetical protein